MFTSLSGLDMDLNNILGSNKKNLSSTMFKEYWDIFARS